MKKRRSVVEPRSEYIMVRTTKRLKEQLQAVANERDLTLSLAGHLAIKAWLRMLEKEDDQI